VHQGGFAERVDLDPEYERVALQAAHIIGLRVAGVDLLETDAGPKILEVNSSPGLEGIETSTGVDIADAIITYLEEQMMFPDLDLRERLSLGKGYSIVDLQIVKESNLAGQRISDLEFSELELQVLSINRNGITIPTPRPDEVVMVGDVLLVYGKELILKSLLPEKKSRRSKRKPVVTPEEQPPYNH
jgi:ribosomal protein S6--L-glutamate ligase